MQIVPAKQANLNGQEFYRYKERVNTIGFGIAFDIGVQSIYVGPESDYSQYKVYYYDPIRRFRAELATITASRPFIARLDASEARRLPQLAQKTSNGKTIPGQTAVIVVVPDDLFDRQAILAQFQPPTQVTIVDPVADVIASTEPTQVLQGRADKKSELAMDIPSNAASPFNYWYFPVFGRKSFTVTIADLNFPTLPALSVSARGVISVAAAFGINTGDPPGAPDYGTEIGQKSDIGLNGPAVFHYESSVNGCYDYLVVITSGGVGFPGNDPSTVDNGGVRLVLQTCE